MALWFRGQYGNFYEAQACRGCLYFYATVTQSKNFCSELSSLVGAVTVISPLELIRTKMQSRQLSYRELRVCIQSSVAQDGWLSLWRGWGPTVLRDVPFSGMDATRRREAEAVLRDNFKGLDMRCL